ncbi:hypothetical protein COLO4_28030 [Corchorus olitorius]|uniref:Uncharacterized protein n=1 Tax=Corchorus olitorius TaxID=93759 RepID=A0A1R3HNM4_9ROSI|nr:hypothetical protein COLO4_28030 [Corchorus olitorius]
MASRTVSLIRDQDLNVHLNGASLAGKTNISKAPRKGGVSGRKPLGDLSNSMNSTPNQASRNGNYKLFSFTGKETGVSKLTHDSSKKKSVSKVSEKSQAGVRKALSDISNSGKPRLQETIKKNQTIKLDILVESPPEPKDIAEEGFLHNHNECIKAQRRSLRTSEFLHILELDDFSKQSASKDPAMSNKMKPMSPPRSFEPREMPELLIEHLSPLKTKLSSTLDSAPPSPEPLHHQFHWDDPKYIPSFKLIESPLHHQFHWDDPKYIPSFKLIESP